MAGDMWILYSDTVDSVGNVKVLVQNKTGTFSDQQTMLIDRGAAPEVLPGALAADGGRLVESRASSSSRPLITMPT